MTLIIPEITKGYRVDITGKGGKILLGYGVRLWGRGIQIEILILAPITT
jgi:hypothetical protein